MAPRAIRFICGRLPVGDRCTIGMTTGTGYVVAVIAWIIGRCMREHRAGPHRGPRMTDIAIGTCYHMDWRFTFCRGPVMACIAASGDIAVVKLRALPRHSRMTVNTIAAGSDVLGGLSSRRLTVANVATASDIVVESLSPFPRPGIMAIVTGV